MAEAYQMQRQYQAAESIYQSLASLDPKDKNQYGPAHLAVAAGLLPPNNRAPTPKQLLEAENHLIRATEFKIEPYASYAHALLFELLRQTNRSDEAEEHLVRAVAVIGDTEPNYRKTLAQWYWQTGKRDLAEKEMDAAVVSYNKKLSNDIDDAVTRGRLIDCLKLSGIMKCGRGDYNKGKAELHRARDLCDRGRALASDPKLQDYYKSVRYLIALAEYDSFEKDPNTSPQERFNYLEQALQSFPITSPY